MKNNRYAAKPSRPFDPHWITSKLSLVSYLDDFCRTLTSSEKRVRRRRVNAQSNFEAAIKAIVLDLYRAHESDPALEVGIATGQSKLQRLSHSRYGVALLSPLSFRAAMKVLMEHGHIIKTSAHWDDPAGRSSRTARYQASPSLLLELRNAGASSVALCRHSEIEGIRLKDKDKHLVEYDDVPFASEAGDRLRTINDMLESQWADLALTDEQLSNELSKVTGGRDGEATQSIDFAARTVYRVFNNNDWEQGGRFYGAWWQNCPSKLRPYILIDGKRTVEVDYSGLHAAMLFAEQGLHIPDDPYKRGLSKAESTLERKLVKRTFNGLLNVKGVERFNEIDGYSEELTGQPWAEFKRFIVSCYPEFKQYFGTGVGLRLQYQDSQLAEAVMLKFAATNYACLPVHDSFIVHHALQEDLTNAMQAAFDTKFGQKGKVSYEIGIGEAVEPSSAPIKDNINWLLNPTGYNARQIEFWETKEGS